MEVGFRSVKNDRDWKWVCNTMPMNRSEETSGLVAYDKATGLPLAATICDSWSPMTVNCHIIIENPIVLRHGFFEECANWIFGVCGRERIFGLVPANNEKALKLNKHLGYKELIRLTNGYRDGIDYVLMELVNTDCKFWDGEIHQERRA